MEKTQMSPQSRYFTILLVGPVTYLVAWLILLPAVAELSVKAAVLGLAFLTALYCFLVAREKGRNVAVWTILGLLAGFVELGLVPVVVISALSPRYGPRNDQRSGR